MSSIPAAGSSIVAYVRDSGGDEQELSIQAQVRAIQEWAQEHSLVITRTFIDEARSAQKARPALAEMLVYFRAHPQEVGVVVWKLDRFARNLNEAQLYSAELRLLGYQLYSITDNLFDGPEGAIYETLIHYANEQYSRSMSVHIRRGMHDLFRAHGALGGTPPRGMRRGQAICIGQHRNGKERIVYRWEPDPALAPLVLRAFEMRAMNMPVSKIQAETRLYADKNSWVTFWRNPIYKGTMDFAGQTVENYCEAIVPTALWEKVQTISNTRTTQAGSREHVRRVHSAFLLSGLVECQVCGAPMYSSVIAPATKSRRREYYVCTQRNRSRDCDAINVPRVPLETAVLQELTEHVLSLEFMLMVQTKQQTEYQQRLEELRASHAQSQADEREASHSVVSLVQSLVKRPASEALLMALDQAEQRLADARRRRGELERALAAPVAYNQETLGEMAVKLREMISNENTRRETVRSLIHRVLVRREEHELLIHCEFYAPQSVCVRDGAPGRVWSVDIQTTFKLYQRNVLY